MSAALDVLDSASVAFERLLAKTRAEAFAGLDWARRNLL
jgi:hypothetical protein